eukprot:3076243-Amphidinium_carterae.1
MNDMYHIISKERCPPFFMLIYGVQPHTCHLDDQGSLQEKLCRVSLSVWKSKRAAIVTNQTTLEWRRHSCRHETAAAE